MVLSALNDLANAQESLRASEERFRRGFDDAPSAMAVLEPASMRLVRVNDAFCAMVGRSRDTLDVLSFADISHVGYVWADHKSILALLAGELDHYRTEKRYLRPDGTEAWASVRITPVRELDGAVDLLFGEITDITERKTPEDDHHQ